MGSFEVVWKRSAEKELRRLPREAIRPLVELAARLAEEPLPRGARKLVGSQHTYRLRWRDYRLVYSVDQTSGTVVVLRVRHRKAAYR